MALFLTLWRSTAKALRSRGRGWWKVKIWWRDEEEERKLYWGFQGGGEFTHRGWGWLMVGSGVCWWCFPFCFLLPYEGGANKGWLKDGQAGKYGGLTVVSPHSAKQGSSQGNGEETCRKPWGEFSNWLGEPGGRTLRELTEDWTARKVNEAVAIKEQTKKKPNYRNGTTLCSSSGASTPLRPSAYNTWENKQIFTWPFIHWVAFQSMLVQDSLHSE